MWWKPPAGLVLACCEEFKDDALGLRIRKCSISTSRPLEWRDEAQHCFSACRVIRPESEALVSPAGLHRTKPARRREGGETSVPRGYAISLDLPALHLPWGSPFPGHADQTLSYVWFDACWGTSRPCLSQAIRRSGSRPSPALAPAHVTT